MGAEARSLEELDAHLALLGRGEAALRLRLGQVLDVFGRRGACELGFSSLAAYVAERCERSVRWSEGARGLARRVEVLPRLREAMASGRVSWSMAEVLVRVMAPGDEVRWLEMAESRTVRQMRSITAEDVARHRISAAEVEAGRAVVAGVAKDARVSFAADDGASTTVAAEGWAGATDGAPWDEQCSSGTACTVTFTVSREDAWLFEATRYVLDHLGVRGADAQSEALLAEAQGTLLARLAEDATPPDGSWEGEDRLRRSSGEIGRWRERLELGCEGSVLGRLLAGRAERRHEGVELAATAVVAALGMATLAGVSTVALDREVLALARALARHELQLSVSLLALHRADGWRRLGYATEAQYARERIGSSPSTLIARRTLAARLEKLPVVTVALEAGQVGVEAASLLARIATASTEAAWVAHARRRTIKHLREDVAAALTAVRWSGSLDCHPPTHEETLAFQRLEQAVVGGHLSLVPPTGDLARNLRADVSAIAVRSCLLEPPSDERRAWYVMLSSLASWLLGSGLQTSAVGEAAAYSGLTSKAGRVTLRLRMSAANAAWWRGLEARARRWLEPGTSWLRFVCLAVWKAWQHVLGKDVAYGRVYVRDRFRCTSPVCTRRDVTPHHLHFRSAGGSDDDENVAALCTWCHLDGVHGGRIRAHGPASDIQWEFGAKGAPCVVVNGRERVAA